MEKQQPKIKQKFKQTEDFLDLRLMNTNIIIEHLENNIKLREMPLEQQLKKKLIKF